MQFPHDLIKKKKFLFLSKEISTQGDTQLETGPFLKAKCFKDEMIAIHDTQN